jgi:hypothetical protein
VDSGPHGLPPTQAPGHTWLRSMAGAWTATATRRAHAAESWVADRSACHRHRPQGTPGCARWPGHGPPRRRDAHAAERWIADRTALPRAGPGLWTAPGDATSSRGRGVAGGPQGLRVAGAGRIWAGSEGQGRGPSPATRRARVVGGTPHRTPASGRTGASEGPSGDKVGGGGAVAGWRRRQGAADDRGARDAANCVTGRACVTLVAWRARAGATARRLRAASSND